MRTLYHYDNRVSEQPMEREYLLLALEEARKRHGFTHPNPPVGAVLVNNGQVLRSGFHQGAGYKHAEAALLDALTNAECAEATLYVTLEPCCAFENKRTGACVELIVMKGVRSVVYGHQDPNPRVCGNGAKHLTANGVEVRHVPSPEIDSFYRSYSHWTNNQRPYVIGKLALSLDGKIAGEGGKPAKLTSVLADNLTHARRKQANALLTTAKTVISDNPKLNVREDKQIAKMVFVVDPRLETRPTSQLFSETGPVVLLCGENAPEDRQRELERASAQIMRLPLNASGRMNLTQALKTISNLGVHELWIESGGTLFCEFVKEKLLNEAFLYLTPHWLGENAVPAFRGVNPVSAAKRVTWSELGPDALCHIVY